MPILTMEELDSELAMHPPQRKKEGSLNKTLDRVIAELDAEIDTKSLT
ncbi:MAG: hypothetical protein ACRC62_05060 [Microcoleus sp.]